MSLQRAAAGTFSRLTRANRGPHARGLTIRAWGLCLGIVAAVLPLAAPAQAVTLVTPNGQPIGGQWQRWADEAKTPTVAQDVILSIDPSPNPCGTAAACSWGPTSIKGSFAVEQKPSLAQPDEIAVTQTGIASNDRDALYWELGHVFDWTYLTSAERRYIAHTIGDADWHWWDTLAGLRHDGEDGLEADFARIYADCAWGQNDDDASIGLGNPPGVRNPGARPTRNLCPYIRHIAKATR